MNYKGLVEKKNDLITRAEEILNDAETNKRELTDDEAQELAEIRDDVKKIKEALEIHDEIAGEKKELKEEGEEAMAEEKKLNEAACKEEAEARAFECYVRGIVNERTDDVDMTKAVACQEGLLNIPASKDLGKHTPTPTAFPVLRYLLLICL